MVTIKDELPDGVTIYFTDDLKQPQFRQNSGIVDENMCKICSRHFINSISLAQHMRFCEEKFTSNDTFYKHTLKHEAQIMFKKVVSKQRKKLEFYKCIFCKMSYKFPAELRYHMMTHTAVKHYLCSYCGSNFSLSCRSICKRTHSQHSHKHINKQDTKVSDSLKAQQRFGCTVCKRSYRSQKLWINHKCSNTSKKRYKYSQSSKNFAFGSRLGEQARTHTGEKPYECLHCSKRFTRLDHLKTHKLTHTGERPYQCSYCSKRCTQRSHLKVHERTHTGEKLHKCSLCSKRFTRLSGLNKHKLTHTSEKAYECSHCKKRFTHQHCLIMHMRIHTGEKPYECSLCDKSFARPSHLSRHKRTHTDEKRYVCPLCSKRFTRLSSLNNHKVTHTGEKAFECSYCNKRFTQACNLNRHKRTHKAEIS